MKSLLLQEIKEAACQFKKKARRTKPRIASGHKVAHDESDESLVLNFSTITQVVTLSNGDKVFLIFRYPLSWIHSITDNMQRWGSGRPATKPFRRSTWQGTFEPKSRIEVYPINVSGVVAMPYVPNYNLHDVLHHGIGNLTEDQIMEALFALCDQINEMHTSGKSWGELIVHNAILKKPSLEPIICDTEVAYWSSVPFNEQCMHDWRDFIFSVCGSNQTIKLSPAEIASRLVQRINSREVKQLLQEYCAKPRTRRQKFFWQGFSGALSIPSVKVFDEIRRGIASP